MSILFDGLLTQFDVKTQLDDLVSHAVQVRRDKLQKNICAFLRNEVKRVFCQVWFNGEIYRQTVCNPPIRFTVFSSRPDDKTLLTSIPKHRPPSTLINTEGTWSVSSIKSWKIFVSVSISSRSACGNQIGNVQKEMAQK